MKEASEKEKDKQWGKGIRQRENGKRRECMKETERGSKRKKEKGRKR